MIAICLIAFALLDVLHAVEGKFFVVKKFKPNLKTFALTCCWSLMFTAKLDKMHFS